MGNLANQERERGFQQQIEELRTDNADGYNKCKIALEKGIQERRAVTHRTAVVGFFLTVDGFHGVYIRTRL